MDRCDLVYLAVRAGHWLAGLAIALVRDVTGFSECHVCLHLAFFRQCSVPVLASDAPSSHDCSGKLHCLPGGLVDLAASKGSAGCDVGEQPDGGEIAGVGGWQGGSLLRAGKVRNSTFFCF